MNKTSKFSPEVCERAVRMVFEGCLLHTSLTGCLGMEIEGQLHPPSEVAGALQADPKRLRARGTVALIPFLYRFKH